LPFATDDDRQNITRVLEAYESQFVPQTNVCYERWRFNERYQQPGESFDTFLADLRRRVKLCNFETMEDELMRDRIICGVRDEKTRTTLSTKEARPCRRHQHMSHRGELFFTAAGYFENRQRTVITPGPSRTPPFTVAHPQ